MVFGCSKPFHGPQKHQTQPRTNGKNPMEAGNTQGGGISTWDLDSGWNLIPKLQHEGCESSDGPGSTPAPSKEFGATMTLPTAPAQNSTFPNLGENNPKPASSQLLPSPSEQELGLDPEQSAKFTGSIRLQPQEYPKIPGKALLPYRKGSYRTPYGWVGLRIPTLDTSYRVIPNSWNA